MTSQNKAIETIRRLLRLGQSSNQHEAELALSKAAELARKHSIDLGCVKAEEERARVAEKTFESRICFDVVEKSATQLCMALFNVRCVFNSKTATYVGITHNVEAAMFAHAFVMEQCGRDLKAFKQSRWKRMRRRTAKGAAHQYCMGWVFGVEDKYRKELKAIEPDACLETSKTAIIIRDQEREVSEYMEAQHGDCQPEKVNKRFRRDDSALLAGVRDGSKVSLRSPLDAGESTARLTDQMEAVA